MPIPTRAQWRITRDHCDVSKGHAKKSPGLALDAYHKAKDSEDKQKKAKELIGVFEAYSKTLVTSNRGEKGLKKKIDDEIIPAIEERVKQLEKYHEMLRISSKLTVAEILDDKEIRVLFEAFTKKDHTNENLDFMKAVDKREPPKSIYEEFIVQSSKTQVNLPGSMRKDFEALAKEENYHVMDFRKAREEIVTLVQRDVVPRFVKGNDALKEILKDRAKLDD